jgi:APA family basic amino acid/polyamine antiporter
MGVYTLFVFGLYRIIDATSLASIGTAAVAAGFDLDAVFVAFGTIFSTLSQSTLGYVIFGAIAISIFGALNGSILSFPRVYLAMSQDDTFPKVFQNIHPRFQTPWVAILGQTIISLIIVLLGYNNVDALLTIILFGALVFNTLIFFSIFKFRKTLPNADRPYRVWGYPLVPRLAILGMLILLVVTFINRFADSMIGVFVILIGNGIYDVWMDRLQPEDKLQPALATETKAKKPSKRRAKTS